MESTMELLDQKLDELDACWSSTQDGTNCLQSIVDSLPSRIDQRVEVILELCCADLEWRWRSHSNFLTGGNNEKSCGTHPQSFLDHYDRFLADLGAVPDYRKRLLLAEWRARSAWGDHPDLADFAETSGLEIAARESLLEELDSLASLRVRIELADVIYEKNVVGEFEVGRQNVNEPTPPTWLVNHNRLLIARLEQTEVSRRQLVICRTRMNEVEIRNVSRNVSVAIQGKVVSPDEAIRASLPVTFRLASGKVTLSCNRFAEMQSGA